MSDYDKRILDGLTNEDEAFLKNLEDNRGLFTQFFATFDGPMKYWAIYGNVLIVIFCGLMVYSGVQLFSSESTKMVVIWALAVSLSFTCISLLKLWFFMRMNHLATLRELKKIEFSLVKQSEFRDAV